MGREGDPPLGKFRRFVQQGFILYESGALLVAIGSFRQLGGARLPRSLPAPGAIRSIRRGPRHGRGYSPAIPAFPAVADPPLHVVQHPQVQREIWPIPSVHDARAPTRLRPVHAPWVRGASPGCGPPDRSSSRHAGWGGSESREPPRRSGRRCHRADPGCAARRSRGRPRAGSPPGHPPPRGAERGSGGVAGRGADAYGSECR